MTPRIDLNTVPSAMEALAASWKGNNAGARILTPTAPPRGHQTYPRASLPNPAPRPARKRATGEQLPGQNLMAQGHGRWIFKYAGGEIDFPSKEAMAAYIAELRSRMAPPEPDPVHFAGRLPSGIGIALAQAFRCRDAEFAGNWEVAPGPYVREMEARGLLSRIGKKHRIMSHFAMQVRRVIIEDIG
jgi:hypothetical protein